jgi:hypothetical protein
MYTDKWDIIRTAANILNTIGNSIVTIKAKSPSDTNNTDSLNINKIKSSHTTHHQQINFKAVSHNNYTKWQQTTNVQKKSINIKQTQLFLHQQVQMGSENN